MTMPDASYNSCVADPALWSSNMGSGVWTRQEELKGNAYSEVSLQLFSDINLNSACVPTP
jgi:hypothetical protein